jgi:hypothetical protein
VESTFLRLIDYQRERTQKYILTSMRSTIGGREMTTAQMLDQWPTLRRQTVLLLVDEYLNDKGVDFDLHTFPDMNPNLERFGCVIYLWNTSDKMIYGVIKPGLQLIANDADMKLDEIEESQWETKDLLNLGPGDHGPITIMRIAPYGTKERES